MKQGPVLYLLVLKSAVKGGLLGGTVCNVTVYRVPSDNPENSANSLLEAGTLNAGFPAFGKMETVYAVAGSLGLQVTDKSVAVIFFSRIKLVSPRSEQNKKDCYY